MIILTEAVRTSTACPAQWDARDADGNYYYLRYRSGCGSARQYETPDWYMNFGRDELIREVAAFRYGHPLDGSISLEKFCELAGLGLAEGLEETGYGQHVTDELILHGITELLEGQEGPE